MLKLLAVVQRVALTRHRFSDPRLIGAFQLSSPRPESFSTACLHGVGRRFATAARLRQGTDVVIQTAATELVLEKGNDISFAKSLPVVCPGCGAFSQTIDANAPGFYSPKRQTGRPTAEDENDIYEAAMARLTPSGQTEIEPTELVPATSAPPICQRCHDLIYQSKGKSILHPSMQSIQSIIESSPHKRNHIYHVVDAADFPMSLIPNLVSALDLPRLRTQNRRSKSMRYTRGRVADVSFIITRSDLLAPQKEQVDRLMPYLQDVLRDALGRSGKNLRLGNVRCVSAKRGWWTPTVKQEIWDRGGAGWVVGKVNVGKSALFEVVFPKGRTHDAVEDAQLRAVRHAGDAQGVSAGRQSNEPLEDPEDLIIPPERTDTAPGADLRDSLSTSKVLETGHDGEGRPHVLSAQQDEEEVLNDDNSLLPPAQPETQYPHMPIVSALPGTTASPIRIPFGKGKGELIDLPGVHRSSLETHVQRQHWPSLVMKSRVVPEQHTLKPGQSLLIGGIIRITPKTDNLTFLAYPFTPLKPHVTSHEKAIAIQTGVQQDSTPYSGNVENIGTDTAKQRIISAGTFKLEWNVTKRRTGSLTDKAAGKQSADDLPFIVYSADILIEGVGWIELVCQVRSGRRRHPSIRDAFPDQLDQYNPFKTVVPEVEVFTPKGKFIGIRRPMNAWLVGGPKRVPKHARKSRPRMSISVQKRKEGGKRGSQLASVKDS